MTFIEITEDNLSRFNGLLEPELLDHIGRRYFRGLFAEDEKDRKILAAILWEMRYVRDRERLPEAAICDLYFRDAKDGLALLDEYGRRVRSEYGRRSRFSFSANKAKQIFAVLQEAGFSIEETEDEQITTALSQLLTLKLMEKEGSPANIHSLDALSEEEFRRALTMCILRSERQPLEDLAYLPADWYEPVVSCYVERDGKVVGFLLVRLTITGVLRPAFLASFGENAQHDTLSLLRFAIRRASEQYPEETVIGIWRRDEEVRRLTDYLLPKVAGETVMVGERIE